MAHFQKREIALFYIQQWPPFETVIANLQVQLFGLNGEQPWQGIGPANTSENPVFQKAKMARGVDGTIGFDPLPEVTVLQNYGCPKYQIKLSCALGHQAHGPSTPANIEGLFTVQPAGSWLCVTYDVLHIDEPGGDPKLFETVTCYGQLKWPSEPHPDGCIPWSDLEEGFEIPLNDDGTINFDEPVGDGAPLP